MLRMPTPEPVHPSTGVFMRRSAKCFPLLLIFALILLSGCGGDGNSDEATSSSGLPQEIVIGAAIAKTGYMAVYDDAIVALEQLAKETNARGGIDGRKLRVIQVDTRS